LHQLWSRRWATCSNGVSWPVQKAMEALCSPQGQAEMRALVDFYMGNAAILREAHSVPLAAHVRKRCILAFARRAARRLTGLTDPEAFV
jgi:hypothetical protein